MTVTAEYAAEHFKEFTDALERGERVRIERPGRSALSVTAAPSFGPAGQVLGADGKRVLGTGAHLVAGDFMARWAEIERDWDENVVPNLWMNTDEE